MHGALCSLQVRDSYTGIGVHWSAWQRPFMAALGLSVYIGTIQVKWLFSVLYEGVGRTPFVGIVDHKVFFYYN